MSNNQMVTVTDIEELLLCLPAVQKAKVVVNDWGAIEEIHILTGFARAPKQIVRDVESALKARWDITIDRRKVSVAQIRSEAPALPGRLKYVEMEIKTDVESSKCHITVSLLRKEGDTSAVYVGNSSSDMTKMGGLLGIAKATCLACNATLSPPRAFFVEDVSLQEIGARSMVSVLLSFIDDKRRRESLLGCALVRRDVNESCVRATLDALNRRVGKASMRTSCGTLE